MNPIELMTHYASPHLTGYEMKQFISGLTNPPTEFLDHVIRPQAYRSDLGSYLSISDTEELEGRNHYLAQALMMGEADGEADEWRLHTYFTNSIGICQPTLDDDGRTQWVKPKDRTAKGLSHVFTFEFDEDSLAFLKVQLSWLRSPKHPLDSKIGQLFKRCREFVDFEGITVNWSGNKSFHIHIVFSTAHIDAEEGLRPGFMAHWRRLKDIVCDVLQPGITPDMGMDQPEKFRRLPNGSRLLSKPNIFGMPAGTIIPQVTLWEKFLNRAPKGSVWTFFDPNDFFERRMGVSASRTAKTLDFIPSWDELDFVKGKMAAIYDGEAAWPEFVDFTSDGPGGLRARFRNHAADRSPSSYMDLEYRTVNIQGSNPLSLTPTLAPRLPKPLGEMIVEWLAEYAVYNSRQRSPAEKVFADAVIDGATGAKAINRILFNTIEANRLSFVVAPEGVSKTRSLFRGHNRFAAWLKSRGEGEGVMYAFSDYRGAASKCAEFNHVMGAAGRYHGVVLESFERTYHEVCQALGIEPFRIADAAGSGMANVWAAVERFQPQVLDALSRRHADLWLEIGNRVPVFFTVHAVAHNWAKTSPTRLIWARSFWEGERNADHSARCRAETALALLIHDEVKAENLVSAHRREIVEWVTDLASSNPDIWHHQSNATARYLDYGRFVDANLDPLIHGQPQPVSFETAQEIVEMASIGEWEDVVTADSGEYAADGDRNIYAARVGQPWKLYERVWPSVAANRVVVLTTEAVPLALAQCGQLGWAVFDLDTPLIKPDTVETHVQKDITSKSLKNVCLKWRETNPGDFIISNKVAQLPRTMTHASARGSNDFMGQSVMQTMTYMSPDEFEYLEALNAWTKRGDLIRHRHIDEFNQTAGRNLGFRHRDGARHTLLINRSLFDRLTGEPKARARYEMKIAVNATRRRAAKAKAVPPPLEMTATEASKFRFAQLRAAIRDQSRDFEAR